MRCPSFSVSTRTPSQSKSNAAGRGGDDNGDDEEEQTTAFRPLGTLPHPLLLREEEEDGLLSLPLRNLGTGKEAWSGAKEKVFFGTRDEEATDEAEAAAAAAIEIWRRNLPRRRTQASMKRFFQPIAKEGPSKKPAVSTADTASPCPGGGGGGGDEEEKREAPMRFLTWNANSLLLRAKNNWPEFSRLVQSLDPHVICFQVPPLLNVSCFLPPSTKCSAGLSRTLHCGLWLSDTRFWLFGKGERNCF
ncbi:hypothetical protein BHM03_00024176 [Ensete ventricosum]|uniref:Endonuclease/exonuclease/phosphatase domain-containing protein n=1 Tax=Ensete ventricosum TaxID=4639 RepID=A0A427A871_ENSVE|nr:hypothetical protein B296_00023188 [Ensete ventricosum]RZR95342.1 hypothetical protein BHM03_00024176 [Ensete ventricosum]